MKSPPEKRHLVFDLATGEKRPAMPKSPLHSSARSPWPGVLLEHHAAGQEVELLDVTIPEHVITLELRHPHVWEWKEDGKFRNIRLRPQEATFVPAMLPLSARTKWSGELLGVSLEPKFVHCAACDLFAGSDRPEFRPRLDLKDPLLYALGLSLKEEIEAGYPGGRAYGEAMATALAAHLVRRYSNARPVAQNSNGGLTRRHLRRAVDYIHAHLTEDISLAAVAAEVGLSPFHFARRFKKAIGMAPHRYLVQCRVEHARELLLNSKNNTAEIACQVGFCDQSHLTIHFRRAFGVTPKEFREQMGVRKNAGQPVS